MENTELQAYIKGELLVLVPVLSVIGFILKKSRFPNRLIPPVLGLAGILLACTWVLATTPCCSVSAVFTALFTASTQGLLAAGASVLLSQLYRGANKK